jgi:hypothetical protein
MSIEHKVGDIVYYHFVHRSYSGFDDPNLGMIVEIETDLYTRYKVKWINREGFNYYLADEILHLKNMFEVVANVKS